MKCVSAKPKATKWGFWVEDVDDSVWLRRILDRRDINVDVTCLFRSLANITCTEVSYRQRSSPDTHEGNKFDCYGCIELTEKLRLCTTFSPKSEWRWRFRRYALRRIRLKCISTKLVLRVPSGLVWPTVGSKRRLIKGVGFLSWRRDVRQQWFRQLLRCLYSVRAYVHKYAVVKCRNVAKATSMCRCSTSVSCMW